MGISLKLDSDVEVLKEGRWWLRVGKRTAYLVFVMCWYIEWRKLISDFSTVKTAHQFYEGLLQLNGKVIYFKNLICLMVKIWDSLALAMMRLQAG
jgi:hypothetical protein